MMYRTVVINTPVNTPTGTAQISTKYYSAIYDYLVEHGCDENTARNVLDWIQVASIGEEYELDGFEIYIAE